MHQFWQKRKLCLELAIILALLRFESSECVECVHCDEQIQEGACRTPLHCKGVFCIAEEYVPPSGSAGGTKHIKTCSDRDKDLPTLETCQKFTTDFDNNIVTRCECWTDRCNSESELIRKKLKSSAGSIHGQSGVYSDVVKSSAESGYPSYDRHKRTDLNGGGASNRSIIKQISPNYFVMLVFLCLFVAGSFSLLIINTVCVHLF